MENHKAGKKIDKRTIKLGTYVRVQYDDAVCDGLVIENYRDETSMKVFFPTDGVIDTVSRNQIYKIGNTAKFDLINSGLWD